MSSFVPFQQQTEQYLVMSPEGMRIEIPKELYGALCDFLHATSKPTGSVVIQFRNGGIAGLEALVKKIYK